MSEMCGVVFVGEAHTHTHTRFNDSATMKIETVRKLKIFSCCFSTLLKMCLRSEVAQGSDEMSNLK